MWDSKETPGSEENYLVALPFGQLLTVLETKSNVGSFSMMADTVQYSQASWEEAPGQPAAPIRGELNSK